MKVSTEVLDRDLSEACFLDKKPEEIVMADAHQRRCFVISPIGAENSEVREHADDVFEFIIQPAMQKLGIHAYRSDHNTAAGKITEQMFDSILNEDICIAILTFHNPNVFYELAIAQSAARPTVILIERGMEIPFDIRDLRAIIYDFKPRAIRDGIYVRQLVEHVRSIEAAGWKAEVPFGRALSPLGGRVAPQQMSLYEDIRDFGGEERWLDLIGEAGSRFWSVGISMTRLVSRRYRTALTEKARAGCDVRIMIMSNDNPVLRSMINEVVANCSRIINMIAEVDREMTTLSHTTEGLTYKPLRTGCLHHQLVLTDRIAVVRLHLFSRATSEAPLLFFERPSQLAEMFDAEFEAHWEVN